MSRRTFLLAAVVSSTAAACSASRNLATSASVPPAGNGDDSSTDGVVSQGPVNPPREKMNTSRYSIPFFMHPRSEMSLAALPQTVTEDNPKQMEDTTAGEFLNERLIELGLKKGKSTM